MLNWQELSQQLQQSVNTLIRFIKVRRREEAALGLAALLFWIGYYFIKWLPPELQDFVKSWRGNLIIPGVFYAAGLILLGYGVYRIWKLVHTPDLPPPANRPSAIKGPLAFTPADGELFRKLGREDELRKLLGYIQDDQVRLIVLMGASGAGKTSLLRAGLTDILKGTGIKYHYWEARSSDARQGLLLAIQQSWDSKSAHHANGTNQPAPELKSLDDLVNPAPEMGKHVIVLDQFEQLGAATNGQAFRLLRKVARDANPPHRVTWVIAFRREYRASWSDFMIPEQERGFFPPELSLRLFTAEQARDVISQLILAAGLSVEQKVVDNLIEAATVDGEVSSVDIGIGLLVLSELHERQGAKTVTEDVYHFAGGAEGLLTQYIDRCLDNFPDEYRKTILSALLALRDAETNQRVAEGKTCDELAGEVEAENVRGLKTQLERLTQRDMRLLERVATPDSDEIRYRLPHERLIPALNRLAGKLIGELEEAKLKFVSAFSAWRSNNVPQYLLKGKDLRLVECYQSQIPWGKEEKEKLHFLKRSQRRRTVRRFTALGLLISLIATGWIVKWQYQLYEERKHLQAQRDEAEKYLRENNYPPELYDYQHQLKGLAFNEPFNLKYLPFLTSATLEELTIKATPSTNSLEGLANSFTRCINLKKLSLDLSESQVEELPPLPPSLTELTLDLSESQVEVVPTLPPSLTKLSLNLSSKVKEVPPLPPSLTELSLDLSYSEVEVMPTLPPSLTKLSLELSESQVEVVPTLPPSLTELTLELIGSKVEVVPPLPPSLTKLSLELSSQVEEVPPLPPSLTELTLDLSSSLVIKSTLPPSLTKLTLELMGSEVEVVPTLPPSLTKLSLRLSSKVKEVPPLPPSLTELSLDLSSSQVEVVPALPPSLTELFLNLSSKVKEVPPLPPSLTKLSFYLNYSKVEVEVVPTLPPSLTELSLNLMGSEVEVVPTLPPSLTELSLNLSSKVKEVPTLPPSLTKLSLYLSSQVEVLPTLPPSLTKLSLDLSDSRVRELSPLQQLNCQTLELYLTTEQRMSLKTIPKSVTHLRL